MSVIPFESNMPHLISELICLDCKYRYIGVRPEGVLLKNLECPNCKQVGFIICTGQEIDEGDLKNE